MLMLIFVCTLGSFSCNITVFVLFDIWVRKKGVAVAARGRRGQQSHCLQAQSSWLHELSAGNVELNPESERQEVAGVAS